MAICREFAERAREHDPDPDFRDHAINSAMSIERRLRDRLPPASTVQNTVNWLAIAPEIVLASLRAAPQIASAWEDCNTCGGGVKLYADGMWVRRRAWPEPTWMSVAYVHPMTPGPGWSFSLDHEEYHGGFATAEEAQRAADESLRKKGVLLLDHETTPKAPQPGTEQNDGQREV